MAMPMPELFGVGVGQDINTQSARGVYPSMAGGSVASAGAAMSMNANATATDPTTGQPATTVAAGGVSMSGHTVYWWLGLLALLGVMVVVARRAGGEEDFRNIRPTFYNFATIVTTSIVGIVGMKVLAAKFRVPGASDVILAA